MAMSWIPTSKPESRPWSQLASVVQLNGAARTEGVALRLHKSRLHEDGVAQRRRPARGWLHRWRGWTPEWGRSTHWLSPDCPLIFTTPGSGSNHFPQHTAQAGGRTHGCGRTHPRRDHLQLCTGVKQGSGGEPSKDLGVSPAWRSAAALTRLDTRTHLLRERIFSTTSSSPGAEGLSALTGLLLLLQTPPGRRTALTHPKFSQTVVRA